LTKENKILFFNEIADAQLFIKFKKMNRFIAIFSTVVFCFVNVLLCAQQEDTKKDPTGWKKADKLYQSKGYMASATKYQMKQSFEDMKPAVMVRIANSYRLNGDSELAEYWYSKCINQSINIEDKLHYAEVLQSTGKCEDAIRWFNEYQQIAKSDREFISDCSELSTFKKHKNVAVENLKALNTRHLDYSAVSYDGGVVFTSTRGIQKIKKVTDSWTKDNFSDVFFAKLNEEGKVENIIPVEGGINKKYHDGVTSISKSGSVMFFSRNNKKKRKRNNSINLKIYSSIFVDGAWTDATDIGINRDDFATCHPSLSADGMLLYFASDRPGGFGGMDIYVVENKEGNWIQPQNLGPTINSPGNDIFPFVNDEGILFFSSNGHKGMGGLDVFHAEKSNTFDEGTWDIRRNLGTPFNTKKDDFGFYADEKMTKGFLTSNRFGGKGGDDIYTWKSDDDTPLELARTKNSYLIVMDAATNLALVDAVIKIENVDEEGILMEGKTDKKGLLKTTVKEGKVYRVTVEKAGFMPVEEEIPATELMGGISYTFELEKVKCVEVFGIVTNEKYSKVIPNTNITLINKCNGEKIVVTTQADGNFDFCLESGCEYDVIASKDNFMVTETEISTMEPVEGNRKELGIEMLPSSRPVKPNPVVRSELPTEIKKHFLGDEKATFHVGQVLTLKNIYYDFNKSNIRPDAKAELDYIVIMMEEYADMEITLTSHTDSRGKNSYNKELSQKRAISARKYIISRGIVPSRIIASGDGENALKNDCKDGVNCSDDQHQVNRRTEILINKIE
jgi:outer membrane protein OmpA-like peptidoglycan-associated protein